MKNINFINLAAQQKRLKKKIDIRISKVLGHGKYIMGPEVNEFETSLQNFCSTNYAITCASGTDALMLALMSMEIGKGDGVFCPSFTFPATAEVISLLGATPIFVDVDPVTFNISIEDLEQAIKEERKKNNLNLKAIIAVDLYGLPADYINISKLAIKNNMLLVSDSAQSFGSKINNNMVSNYADLTCISFFPAKPLGCYGDGGAILCNNTSLAEKIKSLRLHGKGKDKYEIKYIGINSRLDTLQAAILLAKLEEFEWEVERRNFIAEKYSKNISENIQKPIIDSKYLSVWAQYTIKYEKRDELKNILNKFGVPTMVYYPVPMHMQNAYKIYKSRSLKNSEELSGQVLSIPIYPDMNDEDQVYIIDKINEADEIINS